MESSKIVAFILAFLLPPLAVFLERGIGASFFISIILCIFAWFPGIIFALFVVATTE
ncbi:PMP3 [Brettanomyces bruxellensis]|uniref:DEBR0S1_00760g1_1 n=1 Tax=Dekkera bruxellensis TaxID=5007 RepID=A0A7D9CUP2_DEKBR|nr:PMP3 [Brettanomyces bruxellensis]